MFLNLSNVESQRAIQNDNKKLLLKLVDISRGKLLDPDIKIVPDLSAGHSRHASSTLAGSASQRSIKTIHTRGISESMAGDKMPLHPPLLHELRRRE